MKKFVLLLLFIMPIALVVIISFAGRVVSFTQYIKVESMQIFCTDDQEFELLASSNRENTKLRTIKKGERLNLDIIFKPNISTNKKFSVQIDATNHISVIEYNNRITLLAEQITETPKTITVISNDSRSVKTKFNIMVLPNGAEEIILSKLVIQLYKGEIKEIAGLITATVLPVGVAGEIVWSIEDTSVADFSADYQTNIIAKKAGTTKLTAAIAGSGLTAECTLVVTDAPPPVSFDIPLDELYVLSNTERENGFDLTTKLLLNGVSINEIQFSIIYPAVDAHLRAEIHGNILRRTGGGAVIVRATVLLANEEYGGVYADMTIQV